MNRRDLGRLAALESKASVNVLEPPEIWLCRRGVCEGGRSGETATEAELDARRAAGAWIITIGRYADPDDEEDGDGDTAS